MRRSGKRNRLSDQIQWIKVPIVFAISAALIIGTVLYYVLFPAEGYFHSDCTDTIYWANASITAGRTFDPAFYYAGLLPFGASLWLIPLVKLFGMTYTVHTVGMVIFALTFSTVILYLARQLAWSVSESLCLLAALLLLLSSSDKLREIMWGHTIYYSLGLLLALLGLALVIHADTAKRPWLPLALLGVLSAGAATNGAQGLAMYFLPLAGALILERLFDPGSSIRDRQTKPLVVKLMVMLGSTAAGILFLNHILLRGGITAPYAEGFSVYSNPTTWAANLQSIIPNLISLFGISVKSDTPIVGGESLFIGIRLATLAIVCLTPIVVFTQYRKIESIPLRRILWLHLITTAIIFFMAIFGSLGGANWRLVPMLGTGILATIASLQWILTENQKARHTRSRMRDKPIMDFRYVVPARLANAGMIIILVCSFINANIMLSMPPDYGQDNSLHQLAIVLQNEQLEYGYATFWNAQALTLLTDQKSRVRNINVDDQGVRPRHYQSDSSWFQDQPDMDTYFMLLSGPEMNTLQKSVDWEPLQPILQKTIQAPAGYTIFVFDQNPWHVTVKGYQLD